MKCVILCGGKGFRLKELTQEVPKPLLKIGSKPIVQHIMEHYAKYGVKDFVLCLGYLGYKIRDYFSNNKIGYNIECVDTGENATKAERLLKVEHLVSDKFFVSYGDDVCNVDIERLRELHERENSVATLTAVRLPSSYGTLELDDFEPNLVSSFKEKPLVKEWINGGYFIFDSKIFDYIRQGGEIENEIFNRIAKDKKLTAFRHNGFWKSMNNLKDHEELNEMFKNKKVSEIFEDELAN